MIVYMVREIGEGCFYSVDEESFLLSEKSPEMDTCKKYRCFHCGDLTIDDCIVHLETCTVGANEDLNEVLFMCDFLYDHIVSNDLSLPRVHEQYMKIKRKYERNL